MFYLIQGFFFERRGTLGVALDPYEGKVPVMRHGLVRSQFAGAIFLSPESSRLEGYMFDEWGDSELSDVVIGADTLKYVKKYEGRNDLINYSFTLRDGIWIGEYRGRGVGTGEATCILTEVKNEDLLLSRPTVPA